MVVVIVDACCCCISYHLALMLTLTYTLNWFIVFPCNLMKTHCSLLQLCAPACVKMEGPAQLLTLAPVMWCGLERSVKQVQYRDLLGSVTFSYHSPVYSAIVSFPAIDCGDPGTLTNGQRSLSSTTYNSVVTYTCDVGYTLQGSNSRTCQSDGQWSGSVPQCNGMFGIV